MYTAQLITAYALCFHIKVLELFLRRDCKFLEKT